MTLHLPLSGLTHVALKTYHSPSNENETGAGSSGGNDDSDWLPPGRMNVARKKFYDVQISRKVTAPAPLYYSSDLC